jgi:hypothetical protein
MDTPPDDFIIHLYAGVCLSVSVQIFLFIILFYVEGGELFFLLPPKNFHFVTLIPFHYYV